MPSSVSPFGAFAHLKETLIGYLETAYKISHPDVFEERRRLLERDGAVVQEPLIETTPSYPKGRQLREIVEEHPDRLPEELIDLLGFGTPFARERLWTHQDKAITEASGFSRNLIVATGTASGKTEIFITPILAHLLREARAWSAPARVLQPGGLGQKL